MARPILLLLVATLLLGCADRVGRGNPRTLAPLLGGGRPGGAAVAPPSEPVEDFVSDLVALRAAWPNVQAELPRLIRTVIARGSWTDVHHAANATPAALQVRHRPAVIAEVRKLVGELRKSLLRPISVHVAFVEARANAAELLFPTHASHRAVRVFNSAAFRAATKRGQARYLARAMLSSYNGQWAKSERLSNQSFLAGVDVDAGVITPRTVALATGYAFQAAAWRWGESKAIVALTGLYTGKSPTAGPVISQRVHRELPRHKTTEHSWQGHEVKLALPVRELVELEGKLAVARGVWTVAALLPRDAGRVCAVVVKVDWRPRNQPMPRISPRDPTGTFALQVVPIALPTEARPPRVAGLVAADQMKNRAELETQAASKVAERVRAKQKVQVDATFNLQSVSGSLALAEVVRARPARSSTKSYFRRTESWSKTRQRRVVTAPRGGVFGALPPRLERLKAEVMRQQWPDGTAVEFVANHVFVVHTPQVARKIARLLEGTHGWRNQRVAVAVDFPVIGAGGSDALKQATVDERRARALRAGRRTQPPAYLLARGGSTTAVFVGEMHTVLPAAWPADRSSPSAQVFWRGQRLAALPRLQPERTLGHGLQLQLKTHRLSRLDVQPVAGAMVQHPMDATWVHQRELCLAPGSHALTGVGGRDGTDAMLVSLRALP